MEFRLLGPLEVLEHDRSCELGGGKQRALLALLLLHANEVVPTERLIDELWGESPPATVAKGIQVYVSRLRKQLGDRRLVTRKPGYVLLVDASELDVARFEQLLADADGADPEVAARKLREALALWRGAPLSDLAYEPWAQAEIARLDELHTGALEQRIEADLALGRHSQLVGELERLVEELPLREGLRGQLMLCLYRCGRQAEALEVYRATREVLVDELGIEPGRELRELEQAILRQDPALDLPAPETAGEPERESVGREIRGGRAALEGERKQVTVLFADVIELDGARRANAIRRSGDGSWIASSRFCVRASIASRGRSTSSPVTGSWRCSARRSPTRITPGALATRRCTCKASSPPTRKTSVRRACASRSAWA